MSVYSNFPRAETNQFRSIPSRFDNNCLMSFLQKKSSTIIFSRYTDTITIEKPLMYSLWVIVYIPISKMLPLYRSIKTKTCLVMEENNRDIYDNVSVVSSHATTRLRQLQCLTFLRQPSICIGEQKCL